MLEYIPSGIFATCGKCHKSVTPGNLIGLVQQIRPTEIYNLAESRVAREQTVHCFDQFGGVTLNARERL